MLVHSLRRGGAERVLLELALGLSKRGHVVEVVSWLDVNEYTDECYKPIPRHSLLPSDEYRWIWSIPTSAAPLRKIVNRFKPDVIEIHTPNVAWVAAWAGIDTPCVHVLHGYSEIANYRGIKSFAIRSLTRMVAKRLRCAFVTVSASMVTAEANYYGVATTRLHVITNGIDLDKFNCGSEKAADSNILMLGTLSPNKGQTLGIHAFVKVLEKIPAAKLLIVGEGGDRGRLQALIDTYGLGSSVTLMGRREDVPRILALTHILWQLSESEAMPMVVLEAMAAGVPVVGFDVTGTRDAVKDGETGFLVAKGDIDAVALVTADLLSNRKTYAHCAENSRWRVEKLFSLDSMVGGHERLLRSMQR